MSATVSLSRTLDIINKLGLVSTALDVGAHHGEWRDVFSSAISGVDILSIEANPESFQILAKRYTNVVNLCVASDSGFRTLYLPDERYRDLTTGVSLYRERLPFYDQGRKITVQTIKIDSLETNYDYIKIDIQGAELEALRGATEKLKYAKFLELELSVLQYNDGAPLACEVISFLHESGFMFFDITELMYLRERLCQINVVFIKSSLRSILADFPGSVR